MSTKAQVAELVMPYLERHLDLVLSGRDVVLLPVEHLSRGVYVDRTSSKGQISPKWGVTLLFGWRPRGVGQFMPRATGYIGEPHLAENLFRELDTAFDTLRSSTLRSLRCRVGP